MLKVATVLKSKGIDWQPSQPPPIQVFAQIDNDSLWALYCLQLSLWAMYFVWFSGGPQVVSTVVLPLSFCMPRSVDTGLIVFCFWSRRAVNSQHPIAHLSILHST